MFFSVISKKKADGYFSQRKKILKKGISTWLFFYYFQGDFLPLKVFDFFAKLKNFTWFKMISFVWILMNNRRINDYKAVGRKLKREWKKWTWTVFFRPQSLPKNQVQEKTRIKYPRVLRQRRCKIIFIFLHCFSLKKVKLILQHSLGQN